VESHKATKSVITIELQLQPLLDRIVDETGVRLSQEDIAAGATALSPDPEHLQISQTTVSNFLRSRPNRPDLDKIALLLTYFNQFVDCNLTDILIETRDNKALWTSRQDTLKKHYRGNP
jgi:transcriptional regulator with XRE-family HTH domain